MVKFVEQNVMINSIKSFLEVYEDSTREKILIPTWLAEINFSIDSKTNERYISTRGKV